MLQYTVTISDAETEKEFLSFAKENNIPVTPSPVEKTQGEVSDHPVEFDPAIYDEQGNFQWISLATPGLPVPKEYMDWRMEQSLRSIKEGKGISLDEAMASFENRVKQMLKA